MPGILTKKQCWRRQAANQRRSEEHDDIYLESVRSVTSPSASTKRSMSESSLPLPVSRTPSVMSSKQWATTGNLQDNHYSSRKKSVIFSARVHVILIPCIAEYEAANLAYLMWWTDEDYKIFKQDALVEVKEFMYKCKVTDSRDAIRRLYQLNEGSNDLPSALPTALLESRKPSIIQATDVVNESQGKSKQDIDDSRIPSSEDKGNGTSPRDSVPTCQPADDTKTSTEAIIGNLNVLLGQGLPDYEVIKSPTHHNQYGHVGHANHHPGIQTPVHMHLKSPAISKYTLHLDGTTSGPNGNTSKETVNFEASSSAPSPHSRIAANGGPIHPLALICN